MSRGGDDCGRAARANPGLSGFRASRRRSPARVLINFEPLYLGSMPTTSTVARSLLSGIIDYAGLFPPASLSMEDAVREYAAQRISRERWMLGRFVVPTSRLPELVMAAAAARNAVPEDEDPWPVTVIASGDATADAESMRRLQAAQQGAIRPLRIAGVETKASQPEEVEAAVAPLREFVPELYVEIPLDGEPDALLEAISAASARAKARTGGVTPEAIPPASNVARFLAACVRRAMPFKLTAGLHHPMRAEYRLTYESDSPSATMHGFLNAFLAVALLRSGGSEEEAVALLEEKDPAAIAFADRSITWRGHSFDEVALGDARRLATGFGSCSFSEPVDGLRELGVLR